jgi:hypothetical protein
MNKKFEIGETVSGRVCISTFGYWMSWKVSLLLTFRYGFYRFGLYVPPITDEAVHPRFHRGALVIESGWDNWHGYDWFAGNEDTDKFLRLFYEKHCKDK